MLQYYRDIAQYMKQSLRVKQFRVAKIYVLSVISVLGIKRELKITTSSCATITCRITSCTVTSCN